MLAAATVIAGCGDSYRKMLTTDEVPLGTCPRATLSVGESCRTSARDYSAGATVSSPYGHAHELGTALWFRWPFLDVALDERRMRRDDTRSYVSLAGGIGTHLRPMILWPRVNRYFDALVNLGFDLGGVDEEKRLQGRGDAYVGLALDVFAPDLGPMRYLETGVPGLRMAVRYTAYVQGWQGDTTFELGLIWRWGVPVELHRHWTIHRTGD